MLVATSLGCTTLAGPPAPAQPAPVVASPGAPRPPQVVVADTAPVLTNADAESIHPAAFAVRGTTVYLDDPVHDTIRTYESGRLTRATSIGPLGVIDLQATETGLVALDGDSGIYHLDLSRTETSPAAEPLPIETKPKTVALEATAVESTKQQLFTAPIRVSRVDTARGTLIARYDDDSEVSVDDSARQRRTVANDDAETIRTTVNGFEAVDTYGNVTKRMTVPYDPEYAEWIFRDADHDYYLAVDGYASTKGVMVFNTYVFQFGANGVPQATYTLVDSGPQRPSREIQVANGDVYQLTVNGPEAQVLRLSPDGPGELVRASDVATKEDQGSAERAASVPRVSLFEQVIAYSEAFAAHRWTYTKSKNGNKSKLGKYARYVKQPRYLAKVKGKSKKMTGIPYSWGGIAVPYWADTKVTTNFDSAVKKKKYTGNRSSSYKSAVPGTTGIDCSGFVSAVFDLNRKYGSGELIGSKYFKQVSSKTPKSGDILRRPGHVVIYLGKSKGKWIIAEATTSEKTDRVVVRNLSPKNFDGWEIGRYRNIRREGE